MRSAVHTVGQPIGFCGFADSVGEGVRGIEFSLDGGESWTRYDTPGTRPDKGVNWRFTYTPEVPGVYVLSARAVDAVGNVSALLAGYAFEVAGGTRDASALQVPADLLRAHEFGPAHVRPIGGGSLEGARLFRSADLSSMRSADAAFLSAGLGVRSIYDIRTQGEVAARPEPYIAGTKTVALVAHAARRRKDASKRLVAGVIGEYGEPEARMCANYRRYVAEYPLIGTALRSIAAEGVNALVHCANGKDRTGVLCAVLLKLAGATDAEIMEDYLRTNAVNAESIAQEEERLAVGMTARERAILRSFLEARPAYLRAYFEEIDARFGSFASYAREGLHLEPAQVERLAALVSRS